MKTSLWIGVAGAAAIGFGATLAEAGPTLDREARQQDRIEQGVASGSLTPAETSALERQQSAVENQRESALANDGHIGPREAAHLTTAQDRASRHIYRLKHNARFVK